MSLPHLFIATPTAGGVALAGYAASLADMLLQLASRFSPSYIPTTSA
jgi:hypothetical protein